MFAKQTRILIVVAGLLTQLWVIPAHTQTVLTEAEESDLHFMREEEKLARDVYDHLFAIWGTPVFGSIAVSEQRHMDAVLNLLNLYAISDPASGKAAGVFENGQLQQLYDQLVALGEISEIDALQVGITIEETDIADLEAAIAATEKTDIERVYSNLLKGSRNHLSAFTNNLEALGGVSESGSQSGNSLSPGTAIYEPISETLYIPALDLIPESGVTVVYDVMMRIVDTFPQALEVLNATETDKLPDSAHASYDAATETLTLPDVSFGALVLPDESARYSATLKLVEDTGAATIFVVTQLQHK